MTRSIVVKGVTRIEKEVLNVCLAFTDFQGVEPKKTACLDAKYV